MADYTPDSHYLLSMTAQNLPWWKILAELIDNSFDAQADRVEIILKNKTVTVRDNGKGMQDISQAVRLGGHNPAHGAGLGMYGVGLKDAWLASGPRIDITTVHHKKRSALSLDISSFSKTWEGPDAVVTDTEDPSGTEITLHLRAGRNKPDLYAFEKLAWTFSPAILQGRQIVKIDAGGSKPMIASVMPAFTESVSDTFEVEGKPVSICIGLLKLGERMFDGPFAFAYRHRIIESNALGSKGLSCLNVGGKVTLGQGWKFHKNKDGIEDCKDQLEDAIFSRIEPLLQKADKLAMDVESSVIRSQLESLINDAMGETIRENRNGVRESQGTVKPANTGRKRRKAVLVDLTKPGSVDIGRQSSRSGFKIDWCNMEEETIGRYDSRTSTVNLNISHPFVLLVKTKHNMPALFSTAIAVLTEYLCTHDDRQKLMNFNVGDFGPTFGRIIKSVRFDNDKV